MNEELFGMLSEEHMRELKTAMQILDAVMSGKNFALFRRGEIIKYTAQKSYPGNTGLKFEPEPY